MRLRTAVLLTPALLAGSLLSGQSEPGDLKAQVLGQHPFQHQRLTESSGLVASRAQPGILWTLNDSQNPAELFATDTLGGDHGVVRIVGIENVDWEALGIARCGNQDCLYVADVGDNRERRNPVQIYRVKEPRADGDSTATVDAVLSVQYPDRAHNVEALLVTPAQDVLLISKTGAEGPLVYRVPGSAWATGDGHATLVQTLSVPSSEGLPYQITDAALTRDGRRVVLRTYRYLYFYSLENGRLVPDPDGFRCDATGLELQGEGVAWLGGDTLATSSERVAIARGGISRISCGR